jgi:hypothetical protein
MHLELIEGNIKPKKQQKPKKRQDKKTNQNNDKPVAVSKVKHVLFALSGRRRCFWIVAKSMPN